MEVHEPLLELGRIFEGSTRGEMPQVYQMIIIGDERRNHIFLEFILKWKVTCENGRNFLNLIVIG